MARAQDTSPRSLLHRLVPPSRIRRQARRLGVFKRLRKIDPVDFLLTVVFSLGRRDGQSIAGLRRSFALNMGVRVARSSFWDRFTPSFERLLHWLVRRLEDVAMKQEPHLPGPFAAFKDLVAVDATVVACKRARTPVIDGKKKSPPSVKVYTWIRALTGELLGHRILAGKINDVRAVLPEAWSEGVLYLFDMGFTSAYLWNRVQKDGAYFLTRLKSNIGPTITMANRRYRRHRNPAGIRLRMMCRRLKRTLVDVQCRFDLREPGEREVIGSVEFRVIAVWNIKERKHHFYVTNVPPCILRPDLVADGYRLRWEVETFYKVGKSGFGLGDIRARRQHVIDALIQAALIRASVAMQAMRYAESTIPKLRWLNLHLWSIVWREAVEKMVASLRTYMRTGLRTEVRWDWLAHLAIDPNRKRRPTRVRIRRMRAVRSR